MTRLLGAALVVAGCVSLGLCAVAWLDGRVRDLGELAAGLDALQRELGWRLAPLPNALETAAEGVLSEDQVALITGRDGGYVLKFRLIEWWQELTGSI